MNNGLTSLQTIGMGTVSASAGGIMRGIFIFVCHRNQMVEVIGASDGEAGGLRVRSLGTHNWRVLYPQHFHPARFPFGP